MTETDCPSPDLLSAYVDREASPAEERRVGVHLAGCGSCREGVRALARLKLSVRNQPAPPMPADFKRELLAAARATDAEVRRELGREAARREAADWLGALAGAFGHARGWAAAAALLALAGAGGWRLTRPAAVPLPVGFILAAHNQYVRTMPLAPTEKILSELPVQISWAPAEEDDASRAAY